MSCLSPPPPSVRFLGVDCFPWIIDEPVGGMLGRAALVSEDAASLGDLGVHSHGDRLRVCILQDADGDIVAWRERRVHGYELFFHNTRLS